MTVVARRRPATPDLDLWDQIDAVDLFGGPGGWAVACRWLGLVEHGLEWDAQACATRRAAGFRVTQGDVSKANPLDYVGVRGLIASPPCQGFSRAGLKKGVGDAKRILEHIELCGDGWVDVTEDEGWEDHRSQFVLEPLRWALQMKPRWIALEQVPFVLVIWESMAKVLEKHGYHVWTGKLHAEQYGVPQTRERAILIASLDGPVSAPRPTHSRYYSRTPTKVDPGVAKWISMSEALGWGMSSRPYLTVATGTSAGGGTDPAAIGGSGARAVLHDALDGPDWVAQRSNYSHGSDGETAEERGRGVRLPEEPSMTLTGRPPQWFTVDSGDDPTVVRARRRREQVKQYGSGMVERHGERRPRGDDDEPSFTITGGNAGTDRLRFQEIELATDAHARAFDASIPRNGERPAPSVRFGHAASSWKWNGAPEAMLAAGLTSPQTAGAAPRSIEAPSATITGKGTACWVGPVGDNPTIVRRRSSTLVVSTGERSATVTPSRRTGDYENESKTYERSIGAPAPTVMGKTGTAWRVHEPGARDVGDNPTIVVRRFPKRDDSWTDRRPATTVVSDSRIAAPGHRCMTPDCHPGRKPAPRQTNSVRVSIQEAAVLQSFPPDYPWQGNKTDSFRQVGDAVPPLLAYAVLLEAAKGVL